MKSPLQSIAALPLALSLAFAAATLLSACGGAKSQSLVKDEPKTWTAKVVSLTKDPESDRITELTLQVVEYSSAIESRLPLNMDIFDGEEKLATGRIDDPLEEGHQVEIYYDDNMPPEKRKPYEKGAMLSVRAKYLTVTGGGTVGSE